MTLSLDNLQDRPIIPFKPAGHPKWVQKILERPYSVRTPSGDVLYFKSMAEAHEVSRSCRWVYAVFLTDVRAWVPVGIID